MKIQKIPQKRKKMVKGMKGGSVGPRRGNKNKQEKASLPQIGSIEDDKRNDLVGEVEEWEAKTQEES